MDRAKWQSMTLAPRDGRQIIAKVPGREVYLRLSWDGSRWVSGSVPIDADWFGWVSMPDGDGFR